MKRRLSRRKRVARLFQALIGYIAAHLFEDGEEVMLGAAVAALETVAGDDPKPSAAKRSLRAYRSEPNDPAVKKALFKTLRRYLDTLLEGRKAA